VLHLCASIVCPLFTLRFGSAWRQDELELMKPAMLPASARAGNGAGATGEGNDPTKAQEEEDAADDGETAMHVEADGDDGEEEDAEEEEDVDEEGSEETVVVGENEALVPTSKKDPEVRREEMLAYLKDSLLALCTHHALPLLLSSEGSFVLFEVAARWKDPEMLQAVARAAAGTIPTVGEGEGEEQAEGEGEDEEKGEWEGEEEALPVREDRVAYKTIKRLLLLGEEPNVFAASLFSHAKTDLLSWLSSIRGAFLMEALAKVPGVGPSVLKELKSCKSDLKKLAPTRKGAEALLAMLTGGK
jgi:hypothetical protein